MSAWTLFVLVLALAAIALCDGPAPPSRWCIFPDGYNTSSTNDWETVHCPGINSYTYFDWIEHKVLKSIYTPAFADLAPCGKLAATSPDALECLGVFGRLACNHGCPKLNASYPLGYEYPIFSESVCNATSTTCAAAFPDPDCLFNPSHDFFKNVLDEACEGGAHTNSRDVNTNEGFPYVQVNVTQMAADVQEAIDKMPLNSPEDNWCLFPLGYNVTPLNDYRSALCPSANDPLYFNFTMQATQTTPTMRAYEEAAACKPQLSEMGVQSCMAAMMDFMCQVACAESRGETDYETPVFPAATCQDIDVKCALFTNSSCPFSPSYQTYAFAKATSCEGGGLSGGKTATTTYGFPYVTANATKVYEDMTTLAQATPQPSPAPDGTGTPTITPTPTTQNPPSFPPSNDEASLSEAFFPSVAAFTALAAFLFL